MVSAVKVGWPAAARDRPGRRQVERAARPVTVHRFDVAPLADRARRLPRPRSSCSSGTYVRTLADDLGHALGGGAHLRNLRRTAIGSFTLAEALPLEEITVVPPAQAMRDYPSSCVSTERVDAVRSGQGARGRGAGCGGSRTLGRARARTARCWPCTRSTGGPR